MLFTLFEGTTECAAFVGGFNINIKYIKVIFIVLEPFHHILPNLTIQLARIRISILLTITRQVILIQLHDLLVQLIKEFVGDQGIFVVQIMFEDELTDEVGTGGNLTQSSGAQELKNVFNMLYMAVFIPLAEHEVPYEWQ